MGDHIDRPVPKVRSGQVEHGGHARGPVKALVAVQHAILIAIWNMGTTGTLYDDPGADFYTRLHPEKAKHRAIEQLRRMGYQVTIEPTG